MIYARMHFHVLQVVNRLERAVVAALGDDQRTDLGRHTLQARQP